MTCICDPEHYVVKVCHGHPDITCPESPYNPDSGAFQRAAEAQLGVELDTILRDLGKLGRAWGAYQHRHRAQPHVAAQLVIGES